MKTVRVMNVNDELLAACKGWRDYYEELEMTEDPNSFIAQARREFDGPLYQRTVAAIASADAAAAKGGREK